MLFDPKIVFRCLCVAGVTLIVLFAVGTWSAMHNGNYGALGGIMHFLLGAIFAAPIFSGTFAFYGARVHSNPHWLGITILGIIVGLVISFGCFYLAAYIVVHYLI